MISTHLRILEWLDRVDERVQQAREEAGVDALDVGAGEVEDVSSYQTKKFDYTTEPEKSPEYWIQQFDSYIQRIPLFGLDTIQGAQAALKLAATAVACAEHICERIDAVPKPGVPSGTIEKW